MMLVENIQEFDFETVPIDEFWCLDAAKESKMHRIHGYPAKFPAFITTKALAFARENDFPVTSIADIFCGCGTTAIEAKKNNIQFWGCDINPVATLIAKVKSRMYQSKRVRSYEHVILDFYKKNNRFRKYRKANTRLKYWYEQKQFNDLYHLKRSILESTPRGSNYQMFFLCAFSNILKASSRWLTKSIKPQVDPIKSRADVLLLFKKQCQFMIAANEELKFNNSSVVTIETGDFLTKKISPNPVDMIITSPPYVTSYEYADLHQLSSLWLNYVEDYRDLREGSIGSRHQSYNFNREWKRLNTTGNKIVSRLLDQHKSKASGVAKYFLDMQKVATKTHKMLHPSGYALFVIGNTEYKEVRIDNAKHLAESLRSAGFSEIRTTKRKISNKILTPYRDKNGKFSSDSSGRKVYSEEFILLARKSA